MLLKRVTNKSQGKFLNQKIINKFTSTKVVNVNTQQLVEHIQMLQEEKNKE